MLKVSSIGPPGIYLGGNINNVTVTSTEGPKEAWSFSSSQYVKIAVSNVEKYLREKGMKLSKEKDSTLSSNYLPELDETVELDPIDAAYYQSLIGILRWIVELGRVDIACEVSMMSSSMALPRHGHLCELYNLFAYLKRYHNT